ncbi:hypothetical protein [Aquimarina longa]|uniref:hypothetical protein n=1 Tax=Aquimarina longa TaxID=1080221 RepID=UPI0011DFD46D|nr:hypothetical protein [Aquimarina longa]
MLAIFIYIASNPNEDFYKEEFYEVTGFNIPNSTYFNYKEATLPNLYGEYISAAAITLSKNDFNTLLKEIRESKKLTDQSDLESNTYRKIKIKTGNQKYIYYASSKIKNNYYFIGFCTDQKTVIIHSIKS